jgi:hypothetical protein
VRRHKWRVRPVQQARGEAVVLRRHQQLPLVGRLLLEVRARVADEVAEDVLLQVLLVCGGSTPPSGPGW